MAGVLAALIGRWVPELAWLFKLAWFVGFGVAALVYVFLMGTAPGVGGATPLAQRIADEGRWTRCSIRRWDSAALERRLERGEPRRKSDNCAALAEEGAEFGGGVAQVRQEAGLHVERRACAGRCR